MQRVTLRHISTAEFFGFSCFYRDIMEIPSTWSACHCVILSSLMIMLILETNYMLTANIKLSSYGERMYFYIRYQLRNLHSSHGSIHVQIGCLWNDGSASSCHTQQWCDEMIAKQSVTKLSFGFLHTTIQMVRNVLSFMRPKSTAYKILFLNPFMCFHI